MKESITSVSHEIVSKIQSIIFLLIKMAYKFLIVSENDKPSTGYDIQSNSYNPSKVYRHGYGVKVNVDGKLTLIEAAETAVHHYQKKFPQEKPLAIRGVRADTFFDVVDLQKSLQDSFNEDETVIVTVDRRPNYTSPVPGLMNFLVRLSFIHVVHVAFVSLVVIFGVRNRFAIGKVIQQVYGL